MIDQKVLQDSVDHGLQMFPKEAVGFVINGSYREQVNMSSSPKNEFKVSDSVVAQIQAKQGIDMVIHTHTRGQTCPSFSDVQHQMGMQVPWGVVVLDANRLDASKGQYLEHFTFGDHALDNDLLGRVWRPGVNDCFGLARAFMWQSYGVKTADIPRGNNWWEDAGLVQLIAQYKDTLVGFRELKTSELLDLKYGDILLMGIRSTQPNHLAIYLDNNVVMHHMSNGVSAKRPLGTLYSGVHSAMRLKDEQQPKIRY